MKYMSSNAMSFLIPDPITASNIICKIRRRMIKIPFRWVLCKSSDNIVNFPKRLQLASSHPPYVVTLQYCISSLIRQCFFLPKQSQKSRSILSDGSRSLGLFRKGKTRITAKLHRTDLIICTQSREGKPRLIAE